MDGFIQVLRNRLNDKDIQKARAWPIERFPNCEEGFVFFMAGVSLTAEDETRTKPRYPRLCSLHQEICLYDRKIAHLLKYERLASDIHGSQTQFILKWETC